jgi:hypothetical protein
MHQTNWLFSPIDYKKLIYLALLNDTTRLLSKLIGVDGNRRT